MQYKEMVAGIFISRPNRFLADVNIDGQVHRVHVKNTGRMKELLIPGVQVWLEKSDNPARKTAYSLISVRKGDQLVNIDSQVPNEIVYEALAEGRLFEGLTLLKREHKYGNSRIDIYAEDSTRKILMEVKGVTLDVDGEAWFPDAPTERGLKHVEELIKASAEGYAAYIMFVIQMKGIHAFRPNDVTMPAFGQALARAQMAGVKILACDCIVTEQTIRIDTGVPVILPKIESKIELTGL